MSSDPMQAKESPDQAWHMTVCLFMELNLGQNSEQFCLTFAIGAIASADQNSPG
ncbi:hypothetical protein [Kitasatospora sp. NPDC057015]|uniref:hypothetical protein n=1 Tax=Kitasatospora sp. NPDC057015 TaxID=3346001 RepID=UPI003634092C